MDKIIYRVINLKCDQQKAFEMFTVNKHLEKWLTTEADVEPRIGGKFELFWNPDDKENDSTIGCRVTVIRPNRFLAFEWKGPKQYKDFMNNADPLTHVVVFFTSCKEDKDLNTCTEVHLIHSGWRSSAEWEEARLWFKKVWDTAFEELRKYVNSH